MVRVIWIVKNLDRGPHSWCWTPALVRLELDGFRTPGDEAHHRAVRRRTASFPAAAVGSREADDHAVGMHGLCRETLLMSEVEAAADKKPDAHQQEDDLAATRLPGVPHVRTMPASTTGRTRDSAQRGPAPDLRPRGLRVNGRGPYPPPRDGPPGPAWLGGGETSRHRGTRQLSHHCHLRPSELPGQRSIQLPGCPLVSVTSICRKSTSLTMASRCAGRGPQGHAGYLDRTVQEQSRSRPMPLSHPYDSRGLGRPDVTVNPVFTREPVRIPRDRLPE